MKEKGLNTSNYQSVSGSNYQSYYELNTDKVEQQTIT